MMLASIPPAGTSPANPALDPFWALLADANVPMLLHGGPDLFVHGGEFFDSPTLSGNPKFASPEFPDVGAYVMTFLEVGPAHYVGSMVLGGVFERHPTLRCGVIECKAGWLPYLAQQLELWNKVTWKSERGHLSMKPSEYLIRNVRVTPFVHEPLPRIIEQDPRLVDCYVYSSDYPHTEGAPHSDERFYEMVAPFGDDVIEKFFVTNGELLLP